MHMDKLMVAGIRPFLPRALAFFRMIKARISGYPPKRVLVLEGGGMRGIFTAGVLQAFFDRGYTPFDLIVGTSAGAIIGTAFASGQIYLARDAFFSELISGRFIRVSNLFRPEKHILNLDWMIDTVLMGNEPLDFGYLKRWAVPVLACASHIPEDSYPCPDYLNTCKEDIASVLKATAAIPILYRGFVKYNEKYYLDGSLTDPIPFKLPLEMGFDPSEILVISTRPRGYRKEHASFWVRILSESFYDEAKYGYLIEAMASHQRLYNEQRNALESSGIDVIYPPGDFKVKRLTQSGEKILAGFSQGVAAARKYLQKQA